MADNNGSNGNPGSTDENGPNVFQKSGDHLRSKTVGGLMELMPLLITIIVVVVLVNYVDGAVIPVLRLIFGDEFTGFPGLGLIVSICFFYVVGLVISTAVGRRALSWLIDLVTHIPVVKGIFNVTKQATTAVTSEFAFARVVFIEWPRDGMLAMGFVTAEVQSADDNAINKTFVLVYIPTIPNPTSGNMALVPQDDILETDLSVDDAMKLVFSGGIVPPDTFALSRFPETLLAMDEYSSSIHNAAFSFQGEYNPTSTAPPEDPQDEGAEDKP